MNGKYLVFGATGGIGGEVCRQLVGRVESLALSGRNTGKLQDLAAKMSSRCYPADADDWDAVDAVVKQAKAEMEGLSGVAICIGSILLKPAHLTKRADFDALMSTNLAAPFGIVRAAAKAMVSSGGSIVLVSSAAAQLGMSNHEAIAAAKAGIEGLTRSAAASYANRGIRVNCVAPGLVATNLSRPILQNEKVREASERMHPLGRLGQANDVARAIVWLLSPDQSWITGQVVGVDGGLANCMAKNRA